MSVPHIFCQQNLSVCTCHLKCLSVVDNFDIRLCLSVPDNFADCVYLTFFASCICLLFVPDNFCQLLTVSLLEGVPAQLGIILASGPR